MKIEGTQELHAPRERVYAALTDPQVLQRCIPGCESLEKTGDDSYAITIKAREAHWYDRTIETSPSGFYSLDAPTFWQKVLMVFALPMRRELIRPWFRMVARTGGVGGEESFLDPDPKDHSIDEVMRATRDGELFLFINDAVLGVPGLAGLFYSNNVGSAEVTISRR